ncbi:MAG: DUF2065 domain-containing protein [Rhodospirillaceae bacterium]
MGDDLVVALGLVLAIEGALYALFPAAMKRMAQTMERISAPSLRSAGLLAATAGVGLVWLVRS